MPYYHVLISDRKNSKAFRCLLSDLDERTLCAEFVKPFRRSKDLLVNGRIYRASEIAAVQIRVSESPADHELRRIQKESWEAIERRNRDSSIMFISAGHGYSSDDIHLAGEDVTGRFLNAAPVSESGNWIYNPWVVTLVGGLIIAVLAALVFG